jgi:hypothetical protein
VIESINVVIDDEEVERPSSREENQLDSVDPSVTSTDIIKASPSVSSAESPSTPQLWIPLLLQILLSGPG